MKKCNDAIFTDKNGKPVLYVDKSGDMQTIKVIPNTTQVKDNTSKNVISPFWDLVLGMILCACIGGLFAVVILEWLAGCGEVTYFADGTWSTNECLFQDNNIETGTWK